MNKLMIIAIFGFISPLAQAVECEMSTGGPKGQLVDEVYCRRCNATGCNTEISKAHKEIHLQKIRKEKGLQ